MKELRWKIKMEKSFPSPVYCIVDNLGCYLIKHGPDSCRIVSAANIITESNIDVYFKYYTEASDFLEEMYEYIPSIKYVNKSEAIFSNEVVTDLICESVYALVELVIEVFMKDETTFTRHDVCRGIRQVLGPSIEIKYDEWKDVIIQSIEGIIDLYGYSRRLANDRYEYFFAGFDDEIDDDEICDEDEDDDDITVVKNVAPSTTTIPSAPSTSSIYNTSNPPSQPSTLTRHTISAESIRKINGKPGDIVHILVCKGIIIYHTDINEARNEWRQRGRPTILHHTTLKVDKNYNVRLSKYIFDLADMGKWFGHPIAC